VRDAGLPATVDPDLTRSLAR